jgi:TPP-dependent pyruvate/acetoin dehydrogenase alpha subunit
MPYKKVDLLRMYRKMWEIRECDDRLASLKLKDLVMNGFHPYQGEEAVSAGSCDSLIILYRPTGLRDMLLQKELP